MRSRTRWRTRIPNDHLPVMFDTLGWMPLESQTSPEVLAQKQRILDTIPEPTRAAVLKGHVLTVFRARTRTWGIVSREQPDILTIRIESGDSTDVHKAAEDLCESLVLDFPRHWRVRDHSFQLVGPLEMLEKDGEKPHHDGKFVRGRFRRAFSARRLEAFTGLFLLLLSAWCFWQSRPGSYVDERTLLGQQVHWQLELWGRLGTAFAATAVTALLYILFTLLSIGRHRYVVWNLPK